MSSRLKVPGACVGALFCAWACEPDLDGLVAQYSAAAGRGGSAASGGTGATGGDTGTTGGTAGDTGAFGGTGGDLGAGGSEGGMAGATGGESPGGGGGTDNGVGGSGPAPASCTNLERDADESDVDCGGTSRCERCAAKLRCDTGEDCDSRVCTKGHCAAPTCSDGFQNQDETGADCGGAKCDPCADGLRCSVAADCESKRCSGHTCQPGSCDDGIQNQDESAEDCGGTCVAEGKACAVGAPCNGPADCESYVCTENECADDSVVPAEDLIDDFEDDDLKEIEQGGRVGNWYVYGDGTGTQSGTVSAIPGQRGPTSSYGFHAIGMGFTSWGSGLGVDLDNAGMTSGTKVPYDASGYTGVTFWARAESNVMVTVVFPDAETDAAGGVCTTCDHHYFAVQSVDTVWQRYTVPFASASLESGTVPEPGPFAPSGLVALQFRMASNIDYDLWIDDVAFVK